MNRLACSPTALPQRLALVPLRSCILGQAGQGSKPQMCSHWLGEHGVLAVAGYTAGAVNHVARDVTDAFPWLSYVCRGWRDVQWLRANLAGDLSTAQGDLEPLASIRTHLYSHAKPTCRHIPVHT